MLNSLWSHLSNLSIEEFKSGAEIPQMSSTALYMYLFEIKSMKVSFSFNSSTSVHQPKGKNIDPKCLINGQLTCLLSEVLVFLEFIYVFLNTVAKWALTVLRAMTVQSPKAVWNRGTTSFHTALAASLLQ